MFFFDPTRLSSDRIPAFPACFRGLEQEIDGFKQCTPFAFTIPVENVNPAYPELVLKSSVASFQQFCNVWGPTGRAVKVPASSHEDVTSYATTPPTPL